jgi:hypothetical protein
VAVALAVGCSGGSGKPRVSHALPSRTSAPQSVVVTRDIPSAPERCTPAAIGRLSVEFFSSLDGGDMTNVDEFFAPVGTFQWYSDKASGTPRTGSDALDRASLATYFRDRHRHHEDARLIDLVITPRQNGAATDFVFALERTADDLPERARYTYGKGALDCATGKIIVWSLGPQVRTRAETPADACPAPATSASAAAIICTRA